MDSGLWEMYETGTECQQADQLLTQMHMSGTRLGSI